MIRLAVLGVTPIVEPSYILTGNALLSLLSITLFNTVIRDHFVLLPFPTSVLEAHLQVQL